MKDSLDNEAPLPESSASDDECPARFAQYYRMLIGSWTKVESPALDFIQLIGCFTGKVVGVGHPFIVGSKGEGDEPPGMVMQIAIIVASPELMQSHRAERLKPQNISRHVGAFRRTKMVQGNTNAEVLLVRTSKLHTPVKVEATFSVV